LKYFTVSAKKKLGEYSWVLTLTYPLLKTPAKIIELICGLANSNVTATVTNQVMLMKANS